MQRIHRANLNGRATCGERGSNVRLSQSGCCVTCEKCLAAEAPMTIEELAAYYQRELDKTRAREDAAVQS